MRTPILIITLLGTLLPAAADQAPINIDGVLDEWLAVPAAATDPAGDTSGAIDFLSLSLADDEFFLFLRLEAAAEFDLADDNDMVIYLDTDANAATGYAIGGIGAELVWDLGGHEGQFYQGGWTTTVFHPDLRFHGGPTVSSSVFEFAFSRTVSPDGTNPLFPGSEVRVLIVDGSTGDRIPDQGSTLTYAFDVGSVPQAVPRSIPPTDADHLRILTNNVLNDNLFQGNNSMKFKRLYSAVAPDILNLQEIYDHTPGETRAQIAPWLGGTWYAAGNHDCHTISRFPIIDSWAIDNNLAVLIDTTASIGTPLLCINAHPPCCGNDDGRQRECDAIIAFIRAAYQPGGVVDLAPTVPVFITGDLNMVGTPRQLETLFTGDILDNGEYGPDAPPDPDGSDLANVTPRITEHRLGYTWRNDSSYYWPGHLDFIIYSDSIVSLRHTYVIDTREMSASALAKNNLTANDSGCSDHLVFVADFSLRCPGDLDNDGTVDAADLGLLLALWDTDDSGNTGADMNGDGIVASADLGLLLAAWGKCGG
jgi:hypothetical protein